VHPDRECDASVDTDAPPDTSADLESNFEADTSADPETEPGSDAVTVEQSARHPRATDGQCDRVDVRHGWPRG
jgi:hypothetical protein